ncbi:hypothetical protein DERF_006534 [Dermatophagoides farinae]|uniref:Uncharacterized protein n=1 Tax=Dermatophagoides farinae TaxID=6954 RepID=A0A922I914_DERFA|nr:hypothetical protein DERF_006534 [Dermatophagoides farinae]
MDDDMVIEDEIVSIPCKQTFSINKHENFQTSAQRKFRLGWLGSVGSVRLGSVRLGWVRLG